MLIRLFMQILDMTARGSVVIVGVLLVRLLLKKAPKIYSYGLWALVLFRLLCPVTVQAPVSAVPEFTPVSQTYTLVDTPIPVVDAGAAAYQTVESALTGQPAAQQIQTQQISADGTQETVTADWWEIWVLFGQYVWLAGIVGLLVYSIAVYWKLRRSLKGAVLLREQTYLSDKIPSPFVLGLLRPKIYLPAFIADSERSYIIAHEQHHIRRLDHVVKVIAFVALTLHWFNPLVWLAYILFCKDMEMSCDEAVIKKLGPEIRADYATSLLNLATNRHFVSVTPLAFGEGDTKGRVKNMSKWKKPKLWICIVAAILILGVAVVLLTDPMGKEKTEDPEDPIIRDGPVYVLTGGNTQPESTFDIVQSWIGWSGEATIAAGGLNSEKMYISSVQHLPIRKFDTRQELDAFLQIVREYLPEGPSGDETPSFYETVQKYDEDFFRDQTLMLVYVAAGSTGYRFRVAEIFCDGRAFALHLETVPGTQVGDTMMSGWFVTVAVPDSMVSGCSEFDADLDNVNYEYPRVAYSKSEVESSIYTVAVQLPGADLSQVSQEAKQLVDEEWATYDSLSREERMYSSHLWGSVELYADSWQEAQNKVGIPMENPFENADFLTKRNYLATGNPDSDTARIQVIIDALGASDRSIKQIDLRTGYTMGDIRVQMTATVHFTGDIFSTGAGCGGFTTFSQSWMTIDSGENVLLVRADHTNNYANLEAYWVDGNVLYRIYMVGPKGADARILEAMTKLLDKA